MSLYDSSIYERDIKRVIDKFSDVLEGLDGSSLLITGASGLIGSAISDVLLYATEVGFKFHIYLAGRNLEKIKSRFSKFENCKYVKYVSYDATKKNSFDFNVDYIIHCASNACPKDFCNNQVDTMLANFVGIYELLNFAKKVETKNVLFVSSSEIYGQKKDTKSFVENEIGYLDILNVRSAYPSSKRAAETLCVCFAEEHNLKTTIVRPGHIYGPTARRTDNRVSSSFCYQAADGNKIIMKSEGKQLRSYCYVFDCVSAILTVLLVGKNQNAYNISNSNSIITIKEMVELIDSVSECGVDYFIPTNDEKSAFNTMENSSLNSKKIEKLGWKALFSAEVGFENTIKIIKEAQL